MYRAGKLVEADALLLGRHDVAGQNRQDGAVHRHRDAHAVEGDSVEENLHVFDGIDGDAGFPDIADDAGMVGVIAAMGRQIERDRKPGLAGRQIGAVEGIRFLGGRKTGVLAYRPRTMRIHGGARAAQIGGEAGQAVDGLKPSRSLAV